MAPIFGLHWRVRQVRLWGVGRALVDARGNVFSTLNALRVPVHQMIGAIACEISELHQWFGIVILHIQRPRTRI